MLKIFLLTSSAFFALCLPALAQVEPGEPAPEFSLKDSQDDFKKLSAYAGKFVVLEWMNHDCPFVKKQYSSGNMQKLQKEYTAKGVIWLSIISSAPGKQGHCTGPQAEANRKDMGASPTAVLLDPSGDVGQKYGAKTTPDIFIINPAGNIIYAGAIDSIPSANPSDCAKATNYVRETLNAALAGKPVPTPQTKSYGCSVKY
jgi:peroxiredoxin